MHCVSALGVVYYVIVTVCLLVIVKWAASKSTDGWVTLGYVAFAAFLILTAVPVLGVLSGIDLYREA